MTYNSFYTTSISPLYLIHNDKSALLKMHMIWHLFTIATGSFCFLHITPLVLNVPCVSQYSSNLQMHFMPQALNVLAPTLYFVVIMRGRVQHILLCQLYSKLQWKENTVFSLFLQAVWKEINTSLLPLKQKAISMTNVICV